MKKQFFKILLLTVMVFVPATTMARVDVHVSIPIPMPPPLIFPAPPIPVIIPETNVYVVPDIREDIFFYRGWWWRPWQGRWYRSRYHNRGWAHYKGVPSFHRNVPPGWRDNYRNREWKGHRWEYKRVPHKELQRNWRGWERNRHWEKHNWGIQKFPEKRYPAKKRVAPRYKDKRSRPSHGPDSGHRPGPVPYR